MNKAELIDVVSQQVEFTKKDTEKVFTAIIDTIKNELVNGNKVQIVNFGTFEVVERATREGRNPKDGSMIQIAASKAPRFKPAKTLKDYINA